MSLKYYHQQAFTVLELMISLVIGLLISMAAVQLFITNQSTFNLQRGLGDVGDNGRFALEFMAREVRQANFVPTDIRKNNNWPVVVVATTDMPAGVAAVISSNNQAALPSPGSGKQGGIGASDSLTIQYYTPVDTRDCEGDKVPANNYVLIRFFLRADTSSDTGSALACEGGYHSGATDSVLTNFSTTGTGGTVLLSAVDNFQVLLGVSDTAASAKNRPEQYIEINTYAARVPKPPVSTIKLGLLVSSLDRTGSPTTPTAAIKVLNSSIAATSVPADRRVRRVFASTVSIRNVL
jgi:type IV pilus assembly protein PilW